MQHDRQACTGFIWSSVWMLLVMLPILVTAEPASDRGVLRATLLEIDGREPALPATERLAAMRAAYARAAPETMQPGDCEALPDDRLQELFESTALIAFYAREPSTLLRLQCLYDALDARDLAVDEHHRALRGSLIALQRFDQANALNTRLNTPPTVLPAIRGPAPTGRPLLQLAGIAHVQRAALAEDGLRVVAVVHPHCGFSRRALQAITTQPEYARLRGQLQLVVPIGQAWPGQEMLDWNSAHPDLPMQPMVRDASWQAMVTDQTPVFHLLRDGKVIHTVAGWPTEGADLHRIRAALDAEPH